MLYPVELRAQAETSAEGGYIVAIFSVSFNRAHVMSHDMKHGKTVFRAAFRASMNDAGSMRVATSTCTYTCSYMLVHAGCGSSRLADLRRDPASREAVWRNSTPSAPPRSPIYAYL